MQRLALIQQRIISHTLPPLHKQTIVITGASRGIGLAIAKRCAKDRANIAILAKTTEIHPKLPGTIYSAAKQIEEQGGTVLPLKCDIRDEKQVIQAINKVIEKFKGIDILINNASAISLSPTLKTQMKRYDLMQNVNARGAFLVSKVCLPFLLKAKKPQILNIAPPLVLQKQKFADHLAYSISKIGMSLTAYGLAEQFKQYGVKVNALWPKKSVATATIKNFFGGEQRLRKSRKDTIVSDAAYLILTNEKQEFNGKFYYDQQILSEHGVKDLSVYGTDEESIRKLRTLK